MKKTLTTRLLSMLLCLVLCLSMTPAVFAAEAEEPVQAAVTEEPAAEPVEEAPAEEIPAEEPAEELPVEEIPAEEPVEELPVEETPAQEPAEETPAEEPAEETPAQEPEEETAAEIGGTIEAPLEHGQVPVTPESPEDLLNGYAQQELDSLKPQGEALKANQGGRLTGPAKKVYDQAKTLAKAVAAGSQTSTVLTMTAADVFGKTTMTADDLGVAITVDGSFNYDVFNVLNNMAINGVVDALLADCPYDLYWFDKTRGYGYGLSSLSYTETSVTLSGDFTVRFAVCADYAPSNQEGGYVVDTAYGAMVRTAVANAKQIVSTAASYTDYNKLDYYRQRICALTDYNTAASQGSYTYNYGNPWQLIWVFDGNTSTKVVCEGYAKAFQYLCDLSTFVGPITCYSVYGTCGGAHMWNVISMPDGKNYLVDITNCDGNGVGNPDKLFLKGYKSASGNYSGKSMSYTFAPNGSSLTYVYDAEIYPVYTQQQLTLSNIDYDPNYTPVSVTPVITSITNTTEGIKLTWDAVSGVAKYAVYRKAGSDTKYSRYTITTATTYTDKSVTSGTYYSYRIWSMDASSITMGDWSEERGITREVQVTKPTITSITKTSDGVKLTWGAVSGVAKYAVYRKPAGSSSFSRYTVTTATTYTDKNVTSGTYEYRIWALNSSGATLGEWSDARSITIPAPQGVKPVITSITKTSDGVKLTWGAVSGAAKYAVYRKPAGSSSFSRYTVTTATTYTDKKATSGTYEYRVWALNSSGATLGEWSDAQSINIPAPQTVKPVITSISKTSDGVKLTWGAVSGAAKYAVYRKAAGASSFSRYTVTTATTYTDKKATSGTYEYRVWALNSSGATLGEWSDAQSINIPAPQTVKPVITSIANASDGVKLTWDAVSGAAKYAVYRKAEGASKYSRYTVTTATTYTDKNAVNGTFYYYRIWALNSSGATLGDWSDAKGITCARNVTPTITSISNATDGIKLTWGAVSGVAKYAVYRKVEGDTKYSRYTITTATTYTDKNVSKDVYYSYRIWSMNSSGTTLGEWSEERGITCTIVKTTYRAVVIGQTYEGNTHDISTLPGIDLDVSHITATLKGMSKMNWSVTQKMNATRAQIRSMISTVAGQADSDDVTLFYYSGHGYVQSGDYYAGALVTYDNYGITMSDLASMLSAVPGKVVVLLDSCGSGAAIRTSSSKNVVAFDPAAFNTSVINAFAAADTSAKSGDLATSKFYVMTASDYEQVSYATSSGSYFTLGVAASAGYDGSTGSWSGTMHGDTNNNNILTLNESYIYTRSYVGPSDVQVYPANSSFAFLFK